MKAGLWWKVLGLSAALTAVWAINGCDRSGDSQQQIRLVGAGASFPAPLYAQWFKDYHGAHGNVVIEYQALGSGAGIKQFMAGTTDFGASDAAMTDEQIAQTKGGVVLLPMTAGSVVLAYNLPEVKGLKLSREAYAGIFLGKIKKWNDPAIAQANAGASLPDTSISVAYRADGSGTTFVFTQHLSAISPEWKAGPATGTSVNWPVGVGGKQNDGVTALIRQTPGCIGYVEYGYAVNNKLSMAELQNKAGKFVAPTLENGAASLAAVEMPPDLRAWLPDPDGDSSYPIVTYTWLLAKTRYEDAAKGKAFKDVVNYGLTEGQKLAKPLGYIPLPDSVVAKVKAKADAIQVGK